MGLALFAAPATGRAAVIVDQSFGLTGQFIQSQEFPDLPAYTVSAFDDFTISTAFDITSLTVFGRDFYGSPSANITVVAGIYASPDLTTTPILSASGVQVGIDRFFDFGRATLAAGTYWVGAYVVRPNSSGGWYWNLRLPIGGSQAMWHNPGGGFGHGTSPVPLGTVLEQADLAFILNGDPTTPVGGSVMGMRPSRVVCRNATTKQRIVITDGAPGWDCEAAGLSVTPGNTIQQFVTGTANTPPPRVGGSVSGVSPTKVLCRNVTTKQRVVITAGTPVWDCEAAGLSVRPGNPIQQFVTGTAN